MEATTGATIYLASQRGCSQTDSFRSYHTFNYAKYFNEHRKAFGHLKAFNDNTLKESFTIKQIVHDTTLVILLPIVGACEYKSSALHGTADVGQMIAFCLSEDTEFEISNPYEKELINYLHIELTIDCPLNFTNCNEFDLDANKNKLVSLFSDQPVIHKNVLIHLGKFQGREECVYKLQDASKRIFAFVIEGAFEFQNRLLHARDGLLLHNEAGIEFEALSNDAIILLIED
jgi:quercetin 2,3-dioxygenase